MPSERHDLPLRGAEISAKRTRREGQAAVITDTTEHICKPLGHLHICGARFCSVMHGCGQKLWQRHKYVGFLAVFFFLCFYGGKAEHLCRVRVSRLDSSVS